MPHYKERSHISEAIHSGDVGNVTSVKVFTAAVLKFGT